MARNSPFALYYEVLEALEALGIRYVIIGAFAATSYGIGRATFDVDIVVDLKEDDADALAARFAPPRFYADPEQMRESVRLGLMFNIIDPSEGLKADLIPLTMKPGYEWALRGRVRRPVPVDADTTFDAWFARPEDVIVGKLMAWQEGRSLKHETDIRDILAAVRLGLEDELPGGFRVEDVDWWAPRIGPEADALWEALKRAAGL